MEQKDKEGEEGGEEEEHDEDNVWGQNENVPHPEIGVPDV